MHLSDTAELLQLFGGGAANVNRRFCDKRLPFFTTPDVTESSGVEPGPLPPLFPGLGGRIYFEVCEVA
jgi:hypothetical protein